ncbi:mas-related G-protein coupled receptor member H-like [Sarcophilus harrisii]|uniref:mas-related G-protein coupled receptor member H-like n=1 Tax=Sarcophilus harrisii TaxID=9305 RepID=UPI000273B6D1|nr:mas-related G-protein coupled receptor member H-like [Sarcophilus harrisii]
MEKPPTIVNSPESTSDAHIQVNGSFLKSPSTEDVSVYVSLLISILGTTGNGLVIWYLIFYFKKNSFIVYILHLSMADLTFLLCTSTNTIVHMIYSKNHSIRLQLFDFIFCELILFGYNTGLYLLTAISVERCLSVLYPIWYQCQRPKHQSAVVCTLLWALSIFVTWLEGFFCFQDTFPRFPFRPCAVVKVFLLILNFLVFAPLMVFSSLTLFIKVICNLKHRQPTKLYIIIITTVILFLVFAMPLRVLLMLFDFQDENYEFLSLLFTYLNLLSCINSTINPIVYLVVGRFRGQKSKKTLRDTLQRVFEDKFCSSEREKAAL